MDNNKYKRHNSYHPYSRKNSDLYNEPVTNEFQRGHNNDMKENHELGRWNYDTYYKTRSQPAGESDQMLMDKQDPVTILQQPSTFPTCSYDMTDLSYAESNCRTLNAVNYNESSSKNRLGAVNCNDVEATVKALEQTLLNIIQKHESLSACNYNETEHSYVESNCDTLNAFDGLAETTNVLSGPNHLNTAPINTTNCNELTTVSNVSSSDDNLDSMSINVASCNKLMTVNNMHSSVNPLDTVPINSNPNSLPVVAPGMKVTDVTNSSVSPYVYTNIPGDMHDKTRTRDYSQYDAICSIESMIFSPVKQVIRLSNMNSVLYPPNPLGPKPSTREKPLGCKTVFIGGLPEKTNELIVREIFQKCGKIDTIRMSNKKFCHIRFLEEMSVENAIYFSGYRLKIENKEEPPYTGKLHVDYAQAKNDQCEYELRRIAIQQQKVRCNEQDFKSILTHYSEYGAAILSEKLKNEETFIKAASVLNTWLERGVCSKRDASTFYSMVQIAKNNVWKVKENKPDFELLVKNAKFKYENQLRQLYGAKTDYEQQLKGAKELMEKSLEKTTGRFDCMVKIYKSVSLQKVWDHFTKAQRKNINVWKKEMEQWESAHAKDMCEYVNVDMELSDDEDSGKSSTEQIKILKDEIQKLRCQIEIKDQEISTLKKELSIANREKLNSSPPCYQTGIEWIGKF